MVDFEEFLRSYKVDKIPEVMMQQSGRAAVQKRVNPGVAAALTPKSTALPQQVDLIFHDFYSFF